MSEENRLGVVENGESKVFGPTRVEVTGYWRELRNEELRDLYLPNIGREMKPVWRRE
jgi:hypothetical protein